MHIIYLEVISGSRDKGELDRKGQTHWGPSEELCGMQLKIVPPEDGESVMFIHWPYPCYFGAAPRSQLQFI